MRSVVLVLGAPLLVGTASAAQAAPRYVATPLPSTDFSVATAIGDRGIVVGAVRTATGNRAYVWDGANVGFLGPPAGDSRATAVNASGDVAGWAQPPGGLTRAFVYRGGALEDRGGPAGESSVAGIDPSGRVVGTSGTRARPEARCTTSTRSSPAALPARC
jgi:probable HAF family extracellular repeat protein